MKETKVYMELPNGANEETCDECPYAELGEVQHYFINNEIVSCRDCVCKLDKSCGFRHGEKNCPLIDIKTHDRELVKEVCEKIYNDLKPHYGEEINAVVIERVLSNSQKEYEK